MDDKIQRLFSLTGKVAVVTGGSGTLGSAIVEGLARAGAKVVVLARNRERLAKAVEQVDDVGGSALAIQADVLQKDELTEARNAILDAWDRIDILVNAAGGNVAGATLSPGESVFELPETAFRRVFDLNLIGTVLPTQIFGESMAGRGSGTVVNVSSMAADRVITRVVGYSAAKAGVENFTRWMGTELARIYGEGMRVNAIAPGFFIGEQNRDLLLDENDDLTDRGRTIIEHTPMGRFGEADELVGTVVWLCSDAARFVTGIVIPIDGGFSAFSGV